MPLVQQSFSQLIDFTRTSAATFVNSSGNITSTPQSRNLLTFTNEFANAAWTKTNATIVPNVNPAAASLGSELVTNGDFASGTTGWSAANSATLSNSSNRLSVVNGATALGQARSTITTVPGRIYRVAATFTSVAGSRGSVFIGTFAGDNSLFSDSPITASRSVTGYFVATGTTTHIAVGVADNTLALEVLFDDISVREVVGGALQAPDGTFTADTLAETSGSATRSVSRTYTSSAGSVYTLSVYAKNAGRRYLTLATGDGSAAMATFDLQNGVISGAAAVVGANWSTPFAQIEAVGNGWYRCSVTGVDVTGGSRTAYYTLNSTGANPGAGSGAAFSGDVNSGVFLWGAQLEQVPDASLTLGSELVSNGNFSGGSTGWTLGAGISVSGGQLVGATASNQSADQSISSVSGRVYRVTLDMTAYTSGAPFVAIGQGSTFSVPSPSVLGTKTFYVVAGGTDTIFRYYPGIFGVGGTNTIDNISVREVTGTVGYPTDYTRNFGGLFPPRFDYDPVTRAPRGLLIEEQRTNLLLYSEQFDNVAWVKADSTVTANSTTSPDGTVDADSVIENTAAAIHRINQAMTVTNGVACAVSVYARAIGSRRLYINFITCAGAGALFDLTGNGAVVNVAGTAANRAATIQAAGNGWYRCTLIGTGTGTAGAVFFQINRDSSSTATDDSYTGDGTSGLILWGSQIEAGAFATSYIPTVASQVTRSADVAAINAPNFASWFNQPTGTFVVETSTLHSNASDTGTIRAAFTADDGTVNNVHRIYQYTNRYGGNTIVGGVNQSDISTGSVAANTPTKVAYAYAANDFAVAMGGVLGTPDTSGSLPTPTRLSFGSLWFVNGHIRSLRYYPVRLTNAQLQALTA